MSSLQWKYVKGTICREEIELVEERFGALPSDIKETILQYNGGRPNKKVFKTKRNTERIFNSLISFNKLDKGNIFITIECLINELPKKVIPVGTDPFGNYICVQKSMNKSRIIFWNHENGETEDICDDFTQLLEMLSE